MCAESIREQSRRCVSSHFDMTGPRPEFSLRYAMRRDSGTAGPCPDDDTIAALAEGTLDGSARAAVLPHLASCNRCRVAVASISHALADPSIARELARLPRARRRFTRVAVAAVAAAVLLAVTIPRQQTDETSTHRATDIGADAGPVLVSPVGIVPAVERLRWASVAGTDRYRATLFDENGTVLYEILTSDTVIVLPDTVRMRSRRTYLWKVDARTSWGRWSASRFTEFSIR